MNRPSLPLLLVALATLAGCAHDTQPEADVRPRSEAPKPVPESPRPNRIAVKRGTDPAARQISLSPHPTTVEEIVAQTRPKDLSADLSTGAYQTKRVGPFETTVWRVDARVKQVVLRKDGDFFLTIEGPKGMRTVVEVPDPKLCQGSAMLPQISATREALEKQFHPSDKPKDVDVPATIDGVGFFGYAKKGGSGARLMPGIGFKTTKEK